MEAYNSYHLEFNKIEYNNYHNRNDFDILKQEVLNNKKSIQVNIEVLNNDLLNDIIEILKESKLSKEYLDNTAEGKVYAALIPSLDNIGTKVLELADNVLITENYINTFIGNESIKPNCDSLWNIYYVFNEQLIDCKQLLDNANISYNNEVSNYPSLFSKKVEAVESRINDLNIIFNIRQESINKLGADLNLINCKEKKSNLWILFIIIGITILFIGIKIYKWYRNKMIEKQIKFLD
jgi:hypothetical protein